MSIMPPKKKSKFVNKGDRERLFQKFYDNLDNEESDYLGNVSENEDVDFAGENISGSDSDPEDETDMELDDNTPSVKQPLTIILQHVSKYFPTLRKF